MLTKNTYVNRRNRLSKNVKDGVILIFGNTEIPMNYTSNPYHFRQDSNFLYFFGIDVPALVGYIDCESGEEIIFGNEQTIEDIVWMGQSLALSSMGEEVGIKKVLALNKLVDYINHAKENKREIHFLPPYPAERKIRLGELLGVLPHRAEAMVSLKLIQCVAEIREVKAKEEIEQIDDTLSRVTRKMFLTAMRMAEEGMSEHEIAGTIEGIALQQDLRMAYPIICSVNGEILHNHFHGNKLKKGQLLLIDAGSESPLHYATDITRTVPVNRTFTEQQKDIYSIVLDAQLKSIEAIKPGLPYRNIHEIASIIIADGLKALGIMKGHTEEIVAKGAHALFFPHGIGHMMGLDVHDMEDLGEDNFAYNETYRRSELFGTAYLRLGKPLKENFVVTVEPGIYFIPALMQQWKSEKKFTEFINYSEAEKYLGMGGIRIEDNILVTEGGYRVLGDPIPKTIDEITRL